MISFSMIFCPYFCLHLIGTATFVKIIIHRWWRWLFFWGLRSLSAQDLHVSTARITGLPKQVGIDLLKKVENRGQNVDNNRYGSE